MLGQLVAGQFAIEAAITQLAGADPAASAQLRSQLSLLAGMQQQVGTASGNALSALRAEVTNLASSATAAAQDARTSASAGASASVTMLAQTAREQVTSVMAGMKDFDRYLQFGPNDTEAAYHQREAERLAYIESQQAKHTPTGDLNASGAAVGQMVDAAAHGAGNSPEFQQRWDKLVATTEALRAEIIRKGGSTKEFDDRLREDLRRTLKTKGLTDAEIDAQFAAHPDNPLEAAKAFVKGDKDLRQLQHSLQDADEMAQPTNIIAADEKPISPTGMASAIAQLQLAGVVASPNNAESTGHGITHYDAPSQGNGRGA